MNVRKKLKACLLTLALCLFPAGAALAAGAGDFETPEYRNSNGLWVINAAEAYAKGYTGRGIVLGVLDNGVTQEHSEFRGKDFTWRPCEGYIYDWVKYVHGSHVAGTMAANRDGVGMHGVAFDAGLFAMGTVFGPIEHEAELLAYVLERPEVKIINNSWGRNFYPFDVYTEADSPAEQAEIMAEIKKQISEDKNSLRLDELLARDKLMVFSAGNDGHRGPAISAGLAGFYPGLNNWLNVVAVDPNDDRISLDGNGTKVLESSALSLFSELALGAEEFTLAAPGMDINSVKATGGYQLMSGTSMAAPHVSGALGLVQQAYPWMTARQLADTVLSTADRSFKGPDKTLSLSQDTIELEDGASSKIIQIRLQSVDAQAEYWNRDQAEQPMPAGTTQRDEIEQFLRDYYQDNGDNVAGFYGLRNADALVDAFFATEDNPYIIYSADGTSYAFYGSLWTVPFDQIFGQGILDVGKAVDGPSQLNANRMSPADLAGADIRQYTGKEELLYSVDTQGYVSAWNNDISQELWHKNRHAFILSDFLQENPGYLETMEKQTSVGLLKSGEGLLFLTGTNSYKGSTVIKGGALSVSPRPDQSGGRLTDSDVYVLPAGRLQGNGLIDQQVTSWGVVAPGNSIGTLTVGTYVQTPSGILEIEADDAGRADRLNVLGTARLAGTLELRLSPAYYQSATSFTPITAAVFDGAFDAREVWQSPTLGLAASISGRDYTVSLTRAPDAYSRYAANANTGKVGRIIDSMAETAQGDLRNLVAGLDFSGADGRGARDGLAQLSPEAYASAALATFDMHRMLSDLILPGAFARPAQADGEWRAFALPYAGIFDQPARNGMGGYDATNAGMVAGLQRATPSGLTVGGHMAFNYQSMNGKTNGKLRGEGLYAGAQGLYAPTDWSGWNVFGVGRVGVENWRMKRAVDIAGYHRENSKDWTGFSGTARAGFGYQADCGTLNLTPFAALDYAFSLRPSLDENNGMSSRLHLDSAAYHSLRSSLGLRMGTDQMPLGEHAAWQAHASAAWNHELLAKAGTTHAYFMDLPDQEFSNTVKLPGRDSLNLGAGLSFSTDRNLSFALSAGSELFRHKETSFYGNLAVEWKF